MDYHKIFSTERDNLQFSEGLYNWLGDDVEIRVLRKYGKLPPNPPGSS
jgi:ER membrane protein complex subunit 3